VILYKIQNEEKIETLAKFVASKLYDSKCLACLEHQIRSPIDNSLNASKKKFIKEIVAEIGKNSCLLLISYFDAKFRQTH